MVRYRECFIAVFFASVWFDYLTPGGEWVTFFLAAKSVSIGLSMLSTSVPSVCIVPSKAMICHRHVRIIEGRAGRFHSLTKIFVGRNELLVDCNSF